MVSRTLLALPRCCTARSKKVGCSLRLVCMATLILRRVSCSKYFCRDFDKNVPPGRDAVATRPHHGDINHESERTETIDGDGRRDGEEADAGAGSEADEGVLPPEQAHLETVSGRWGRGIGASAEGPAQRAAQAGGPASAGAGPLCGGTLRRLRADADGRAAGEGTAGGRSRDVAAVAAGGGPAHGASPQAGAPGMARAQAELRSDGATGRLAP